MTDIEDLQVNHPWTTMLDWEAMTDAWNRGAEWAYRNSGIRNNLDTTTCTSGKAFMDDTKGQP
jgi:hypothetical protein